jgi:Ca2+/H+ antiporter
MKYSKKIDYLFIVIGCFVAIYAQAEEEQNQLILVLGIVLLMYGLFRISSTIPHKKNKDNDSAI